MALASPPAPPRSAEELVDRASALAGRSLGELAQRFYLRVPTSLTRDKGWIGQLLELALGARAASRPVPDFEHLGIELKTLPVNEDGHPRESTFIGAVPVDTLHELTWETSHVRRKLHRVLWIPVESNPDLPLGGRRIGRPHLWSCDDDPEAETLREDWEHLAHRIRLGYIDAITARDGKVLQLRPKAADASAARATVGEDGWLVPTLPRGWYLRATFTRRILARHYALPVT